MRMTANVALEIDADGKPSVTLLGIFKHSDRALDIAGATREGIQAKKEHGKWPKGFKIDICTQTIEVDEFPGRYGGDNHE